MSTKNDGGPAFPYEPQLRVGQPQPGMTLREWYAGHAMAALAPTSGLIPKDAAWYACRYADALIAELGK